METVATAESTEIWDFVWESFANASLTYDLVSSQQNGTKGNADDNFLFDNPAKLGILTGFLVACLADFGNLMPELDVGLEWKLKAMATTLINIIIFLLLAPIISVTLIVLCIYRRFVELALGLQLGDDFAGLLEGTDNVWALEESTALSVINVLALLEQNNSTKNENFLLEFRNLINERLVSSNFDKLNWLREKKYGYCYWRRTKEIRIEERVRWIDEDEKNEKYDDTCNETNVDFLQNILTKTTNKMLPKKHSTSWEILIGKNCLKSSSRRLQEMEEGLAGLGNESNREKTTIPVLFRVHHCLGDGVALLRLLLESIADPESLSSSENNSLKVDIPQTVKNNCELRVPLLRKSSSILETIRAEEEIIYYAKDLLSASMPFTARISLPAMIKSIIIYIDTRFKIVKSLTIDDFKTKFLFGIEKKINEFCRILGALISIPSCLVQQTLRSMDKSALHGPKLTGQKLLSCWIESDVVKSRDRSLLSKIRDIKNATGTRFGDVFLAALSANLYRYFSKIDEAVPKSMTVVIPARMSTPTQKLSLQNGFSVGLLPLCISEINGALIQKTFHDDSNILERLTDVSRSSEQLRKDPDYLINFWVMKWLSAILPECLLKPVLESHSTLVFSNLPGPQEVAILGHKLKNVAFWIPHRGTTGIGCSLLTYGGKVHITLVGDAAVVRNQRLLDDILKNTVEDIHKLYDMISLSCFTIDLRDRF